MGAIRNIVMVVANLWRISRSFKTSAAVQRLFCCIPNAQLPLHSGYCMMLPLLRRAQRLDDGIALPVSVGVPGRTHDWPAGANVSAGPFFSSLGRFMPMAAGP